MTDAVEAIAEPVEATRAFWRDLGLSGLVDVHVHFLPPRLQDKVWAVFDSAGPKIGREWPIRYRQPHAERVEILRSFGVRRFSSLPYAHRPGVATWLNDWSREFAAGVPECLWSGTFYPEPDAGDYVRDLVDGGVEILKIHVQVGEFRVDDPLLDPVWGVLEDAGTPVVVHAGSAPVPGSHTGPGPVAAVLERFPRLCLVIAHLGAPECSAFADLAERYKRVHLDTTMMFTDFFAFDPPGDLVPLLADLQPKVLLGTDFPTIPYPYHHQLEVLARLDLGDDWLRDVCWNNGVRLFGEPPAAPD